MKNCRVVFIALVVFLSGFVLNVYAEEIKVAGGGGPVDNILKPVKEHFEEATGIKLNIIPSGAVIAFKELGKGSIDASSAGFSFEDLISTLKKEGNDVQDISAYQPVTIGKGNIYTIAHKDNPVANLTKDQLKGIFTGQISNWKDVGGKDIPIIIVMAKLNPATNNTYMKAVLDGVPFAKDVLEATTSDDLKQNILSNPEAIGFGPATIADTSVKVIGTPEVSRPIILVTKGSPSPQVQKLISYIKGEGQKYVKQ